MNSIIKRSGNYQDFNDSKKIFLVDGFPRQGNTFLQYVLSYCLLEEEDNLVLGRTHSESKIDMFPSSSIIISPTRDPYDTIPSWILKSGIKPSNGSEGSFSDGSKAYVKSEIKKYIKMSNFILNKKLDGANVIIVPFHLLSKDVYKIVSYIFEATGSRCDKELPWPSTNKFFLDMMSKDNKKMIDNNKPVWVQHGYIPREKPDYYESIKKLTMSEEFSELMIKAKNCHNSLIMLSPWPDEDISGW